MAPVDLDFRTADLSALRALPAEELTKHLHQLQPTELAALFTHLGDEALADLLAELDAYDAARLIGKLSRAQAADVLEEMDPDDAAEVVEELAASEVESILTEMQPAEAEHVRELMAYPQDSAGRLMTPEYVAIKPDLTAHEAMAAIRRLAEEAETIYYTYVTDPATERLLGVLSLRNLVLSRPSTPVRELMVSDVIKIRADADREAAARLLDQHHLIALPVVDEQDRLLGIITADDAAEVLLDEAGEDIERLGGSEPLEAPYLRSSVFDLIKKRGRWLLLLFVAQAYTGTVMKYFQAELQQVVALTFFIPLLIGTGGNAGTQITTTLTRALATGEVSPRDLPRVLLKEWGVAGLMGLLMATGCFVGAWALGLEGSVGVAVALAAACIVLWAATVAAILPLLLRRLRLDPAVISGPLISTIVDGTGLIAYFEISRLVLRL